MRDMHSSFTGKLVTNSAGQWARTATVTADSDASLSVVPNVHLETRESFDMVYT